MAFVATVESLRQTLAVDSELSLPAAIASMTEQMGLPTRRHDGTAVPLIDQVGALQELLGDADESSCALSDRDDLSVSTPAERSSNDTQSVVSASSSTAQQSNSSNTKRQATVGGFFGPGLIKRYRKGKLVDSSLSAQQDRFAEWTQEGSVKQCICGREFFHAPAYLVHQRYCARAALGEEEVAMSNATTSEPFTNVATEMAPEPEQEVEKKNNNS